MWLICEIKYGYCRYKPVIQPVVKDEVFKPGKLVNPQCGGSGSWNIYTAREGDLRESKAWQLEPHSKETDKSPEDSCNVLLCTAQGKKKKKNRNNAGEKYLDLKFSSKHRHGKGK